MKKVILVALLLPAMAKGQIVQNFESGDTGKWIQAVNGHWVADTSGSINGRYSLHHFYDDTIRNSDFIGLPLSDLHPSESFTVWSFMLKHGYDPSSSNKWAVYIMSDIDPGSIFNGSPASGYAAGVNMTGSDDTLRLWKIINGKPSVVVTCSVNWQALIGKNRAAKVMVSRNTAGVWDISVFDPEDRKLGSGTGSDDELFSAQWLVISYSYTASCDRLLWMDDIEVTGKFYRDTVPPDVAESRLIDQNTLDIILDEEPAGEVLLPENFSLMPGPVHPSRVSLSTSTTISLEFEDKFINKTTCVLMIGSLCDKKGNCRNETRISFLPVWAEEADIIISEIMADPSPAVSLPENEYLELYNRTRYGFNLEKWTIVSGNRETVLPGIELKAGSYLIICAPEDTSCFKQFGNVLGVKPFPSLTNAGSIITVTDSQGNLIHGVGYSQDMYGDNLKSGGGWSLEMIDTGYPFYSTGNWKASVSVTGGTPGSTNSVSEFNPDPDFAGILNVFPEDSATVTITFSETTGDLSCKSGMIFIDGQPVTSTSGADPLGSVYTVKPGTCLERGKIYRLEISDDVMDFAGNRAVRRDFSFGIPGNATLHQIEYNELLFNPLPDDVDYIELYNNSPVIADASALLLASVNEAGEVSVTKSVSEEHRCIIPYSFYVITTDPGKVASRYFSSDRDFIFRASSLPSMPDDKGHLLLLNRQLDIIDEVTYTENMHFELLQENEGVALEKIRHGALSTESENWHSASESSGFGTPGVENSSFLPGSDSGDIVTLSSARISPDNDGWEDILVIDMTFTGNGNVVSATVFNESGRLVKKIAENLFAGNKVTMVWDATGNDGNIVSRGIYIVLIKLYDDKGKKRSWKKVCTVLR